MTVKTTVLQKISITRKMRFFWSFFSSKNNNRFRQNILHHNCFQHL